MTKLNISLYTKNKERGGKGEIGIKSHFYFEKCKKSNQKSTNMSKYDVSITCSILKII